MSEYTFDTDKELIFTAIEDYFKIPVNLLFKKNKKRPSKKAKVLRARWFLSWLMYNTGRYTLQEIGDELGGIHHTTVRHGINSIEDNTKIYTDYRTDCNALKALITTRR